MARAKRTDRTEARRRYRAELAALAPDDAGATDDPTTASAPRSGSKAASAGASAQPGPRPSIRAAFSGAIRPLDLRGDLRAAPRVLTHWAVLAAIAISIVSAIAFVVSTDELFKSVDWTAADPLAGKQFSTVGSISFLGVQLFVLAPPFAGAFLIGFTAKRASWLGGLVFGIVAAGCFAGILQTEAWHALVKSGESPQLAVSSSAAISPVGAALFASIAAWYRRFLELANPNRNQRQQQKPQQGRGNMRPARR